VKYVLDTNVVSSLMKGEPRVLSRLKRAERASVLLPQPVIAEIAYGIARLSPSKRRELLTDRFELVKSELCRSVWSDEVSEAFGAVKSTLERRGERLEDFDLAAAAHAIAERAVLVTADRRHLPRVPDLTVEDWANADEP
jgi:tRNA(fMet)-specific endonuclease VapC